MGGGAARAGITHRSLAGVATAASAGAWVLQVWRRGRAPNPTRPGELSRGPGIAARETVDVLHVPRAAPTTGRPCAFGAGAALIVDETALLIELDDVYWSDKGVLSIGVGQGATSALASLALLVRLVRRGEALILPDPPDGQEPTAVSAKTSRGAQAA